MKGGKEEGRLTNKAKIKPQHMYHLIYYPILCTLHIKTF